MTLPVVFCAPGGGLGHLNRAGAIARQLALLGQPSLVLVTTPFVSPGIADGLNLLRLPSAAERESFAWDPGLVPSLLDRLAPAAVVVDTFPDGLQQELQPWLAQAHCPAFLIQRDRERPVPDLFTAVFLPYPDGAGYVLNRQPHQLRPRAQARQCLRADSDIPLVLCAHNGSPPETRAFFRQALAAAEPALFTLRLATLLPLADPEFAPYLVSCWPLAEMYPGIDLLLAGAGYNTVAECLAFGQRALFRPFARPEDSQAARVEGMDGFHETTPPAALRQLLLEKLAEPTPQPLSTGIDGAAAIARAIADQLTRP